MRLLAVLLAAYMLAAVQPAWAYLETLPGDPEWPEIPDRSGMAAFLGRWMPQCNVGVVQNAGDMTIHEDGRFNYERNKGLPTRYRVIEETPHYVVNAGAADGRRHRLLGVPPPGQIFPSPWSY